MAKHPHRLLLVHKKTWRCTLEGCNFFVHLGLAHVLVGKTAVCWECGEHFIIDEYALRDEMPKCFDCRPSFAENMGTETVDTEGMTPEKEKILRQLGLLGGKK